MPAISRTVTLASANGLHARPAQLLAQRAKISGHRFTITKGDKTANAASLLALMSLGAQRGDLLTISSEVAEAEPVLAELESILATDHDAAEVGS